MRIKHLTTDEILRIYSPETELERVLFDRIGDALSRADEAENVNTFEGELDRLRNEYDDLEHEHEELTSAIKALDPKSEDIAQELENLIEGL